jgi:transposase InsO family protein
MPFCGVSAMDRKREFVELARAAGANVRELCRRYGVSPTTGYKWLGRFRAEGAAGLGERSRRPGGSPGRTPAAGEAAVLAVRAASNEAWGGRKIRRVLADRGAEGVPAASTITAILRRGGRLSEAGAAEHPGPLQRFERATPNELWQMDFKGHFALHAGRCHPLTALDDCSRYNLVLSACGDERAATVRGVLEGTFRRYGMPLAMLMDWGSPWGDSGGEPLTGLAVWLMRLGVRVLHGRPRHPQTQGKEERFHRTLEAEAMAGRSFRDLAECQRAFDAFRHRYNHERPHEALGMTTPALRYRASPRPFPKVLPPIDYGPGDAVRRVDGEGYISFRNRPFRVGKGLRAQPVALRPTADDGRYAVFFCSHRVREIDLRLPAGPTCGLVDDAERRPQGPQAPQQQP